MRIAMLNITAGGLSSGYKKYLENTIPRLASHPKVSKLLVGFPETMDISAWKVRFTFVEWISLKTQSFPWQNIGGAARRKISQFKPDVLFIPTGRFLKIYSVPVVNMIHNMEPLANINKRNPYLVRIKNRVRAKLAKKAVQNADLVIAVSEYVRDFLGKTWNIPRSKMSVIYHGLNYSDDRNNVKPVVIPESWNGKFLFTAGAIRPSRGLEDIISAIDYLVSEDTHYIDNIIIAGTTHSTMNKYRHSLQKTIEKKRINDHIFFAGNLNEQEMNWCYQNCAAFIMTSRVEACPNVALEAMSHGCLCISADNPPLPEIFAEGALYYQSKNGKSLVEAIQTVFSWDNHQRHRSSKLAKQRAADFSWDITANETVQELEKVIDESKYHRRQKNVRL